MKFAIKTDSGPLCYNTELWAALESSKSGQYMLVIEDKPLKIDRPSFDLIYYLSENERFKENSTMVVDKGHVYVWS